MGRQPAEAAVRAPDPRPEVAQAGLLSQQLKGPQAPVAQAALGDNEGRRRGSRPRVGACLCPLPQTLLNKAWGRSPICHVSLLLLIKGPGLGGGCGQGRLKEPLGGLCLYSGL